MSSVAKSIFQIQLLLLAFPTPTPHVFIQYVLHCQVTALLPTHVAVYVAILHVHASHHHVQHIR